MAALSPDSVKERRLLEKVEAYDKSLGRMTLANLAQSVADWPTPDLYKLLKRTEPPLLGVRRLLTTLLPNQELSKDLDSAVGEERIGAARIALMDAVIDGEAKTGSTTPAQLTDWLRDEAVSKGVLAALVAEFRSKLPAFREKAAALAEEAASTDEPAAGPAPAPAPVGAANVPLGQAEVDAHRLDHLERMYSLQNNGEAMLPSERPPAAAIMLCYLPARSSAPKLPSFAQMVVALGLASTEAEVPSISRCKAATALDQGLLCAALAACDDVEALPGIATVTASDEINAEVGGKTLRVGAKVSAARALVGKARKMIEAEGVIAEQVLALPARSSCPSHRPRLARRTCPLTTGPATPLATQAFGLADKIWTLTSEQWTVSKTTLTAVLISVCTGGGFDLPPKQASAAKTPRTTSGGAGPSRHRRRRREYSSDSDSSPARKGKSDKKKGKKKKKKRTPSSSDSSSDSDDDKKKSKTVDKRAFMPCYNEADKKGSCTKDNCPYSHDKSVLKKYKEGKK